jgi:hypothetical protein
MDATKSVPVSSLRRKWEATSLAGKARMKKRT